MVKNNPLEGANQMKQVPGSKPGWANYFCELFHLTYLKIFFLSLNKLKSFAIR